MYGAGSRLRLSLQKCGLPRTVLAAEACLFFSRPPKATAPLANPPQRLYGASSRGLLGCDVAAEACLFFSRPPKATAPLKPLSAPLAATLQRSLGNHQGQGVSLGPRCRFWVAAG